MFPESVQRWLAVGERGVSSETIVGHIYGFDLAGGWAQYDNHPHDPDDFRRCALLLRSCPEVREQFDKMRSKSTVWARLVDRWDDIEKSFVAECGEDMPRWKWSAPKTYDLMRSIIDRRRATGTSGAAE